MTTNDRSAGEQLLHLIYEEAPFLKNHLFYLAYAGSRSYGTAAPESDIDLRGVAFAPRETIFGLDTYEQTILPQPDTVIYSLKKYVQLAVKANPNILELLFVEPDELLVCTSVGEKLRSHRQLFLSKKVFQSFGGYAIRNIRKLKERQEVKVKEERSRETRGAGVEFDTKDASHLIRLLQTGIELLKTGSMQVKRPNREELLAIKRGEWELTPLLAYADQLFFELERAYQKTSLPEQPGKQAIEKMVIELNESFYLGRG